MKTEYQYRVNSNIVVMFLACVFEFGAKAKIEWVVQECVEEASVCGFRALLANVIPGKEIRDDKGDWYAMGE